jgi:dihydropteroate synthase
MDWHFRAGRLTLDRPRIVGILNVTPDSFSDGGRLRTIDEVRRHAARLVDEGADVLDVGGESTRPGAERVDTDEERRRVLPAIEAISATCPDVPISVDTVKASIAADALSAGASIVNDVSALRLDPEMAGVCAASGAGVVLMHSRGDVASMATFAHASYGNDPMEAVIAELGDRVAVAERAGVRRERIVLDPGIGFAKRAEHSLAVLAGLDRLVACGLPVLVGASRKRFIGALTHRELPSDRAAGTVGANVLALVRGARLFRVHDVRASRDALDVAWAILQAAHA